MKVFVWLPILTQSLRIKVGLFQRHSVRCRRISRSLGLIIGLLLLNPSLALALDYTWTGSVNTSWGTQGNWDSGDGTPGNDGFPDDASDTATISSSSQTITTGAARTIGALTLSGTFSGTLTLSGSFQANSISLSAGRLIDNAQTVTVNGNIIIANVANLLTSTGIWEQAANGNISNPNSESIINTLQISNNVTSTRTGQFHARTIVLGTNTTLGGGSALNLRPTSNNFIDLGSGASILSGRIYITLTTANVQQKALNVGVTVDIFGPRLVTMTGDWTVGNLSVTGNSGSVSESLAGRLDTNGYNLTVQGNLEVGWDNAFIAGSGQGKIFFRTGTHIISGALYTPTPAAGTYGYYELNSASISVGSYINWNNSTVTPGTSTVIFNGTGTQTLTSAGQSLNDLVVNGTGNTVTLADALTVDGDLTLTSGTLDVSASNYGITLGGDWTRNGGTFTPRSGTVTFTGGADHTISGATTFYNFTMVENDDGADSTLTFIDDEQTTITGTWTLTGNSGDLIRLRSSVDTSQWHVDPRGTRSMAWVDVKDSNNRNLINVDCLDNCVNVSGNSYWTFGLSPDDDDFGVAGRVYESDGVTPVVGVTVQAALNGSPVGITPAVTNASGEYQITDAGPFSAGDVVTAYIDGGSDRAVTVTRTDGGSLGMTDDPLDLYVDHLIVRDYHEGTLTNAHLGTGEVADADVTAIYEESGGAVTVKTGKTLLVWAGDSFAPGNTVNTDHFRLHGTLALGSNTLNLTGNWFVSSTGVFSNASSTVNFIGTGAQTVTCDGEDFDDLVINGTGNTVTLGDTLMIGGDLTLTSGELDVSASNFGINAAGSWTFNGGTFTPRTGTVTFTAPSGSHTITSDSNAFGGLLFNGVSGATWTLQDNLEADAIQVSAGRLIDNGMTVTVNGNILIDNVASLLTSTGIWEQAANGNIRNANSSNPINELSILDDVTSTRVSYLFVKRLKLGVNAILTGNYYVYLRYTDTNNFIDQGAGAQILQGMILIQAKVGQTLSQQGLDTSVDITFYFFSESTIRMTGDWFIGNLQILGGANYSNSPKLDTNGQNLTIEGSLTLGKSNAPGANNLHGAILFSSGTHVITGNIRVDLGNGGTHGYFDLGSANISVGGNVDFTDATVTPGTSTVTFDGAGAQTLTSAGESFHDLVVDGTTNTVTLADAMTVNGDLSLTSGTLDASTGNYGLTLGGDWLKTGGTFTPRSGTVTLTGGADHTISGATTFYNFTMIEDDDGSDSTLTFIDDEQTTISGTWTLTGNSGDLIRLRSSVDTSQWHVDPRGPRLVSWLDVKDSNNRNLINVDCLDNCDDSFGNSYWTFGLDPMDPDYGVAGRVYEIDGVTPVVGVTVQAALNGSPVGITPAVTNASGEYQIVDAGPFVAGDVVTAYIDGGTDRAVTVTRTAGGSLGMLGDPLDLIIDHLIVRDDHLGTLTNAHLATGEVADTDVTAIYETSGGAVTVKTGKTLLVWADHEFAPGAEVTTHHVKINGTFTLTTESVDVGGDWTNAGTVTEGTSTVTLSGTGAQSVTADGSDFNDLVVTNATAAVTFTDGFSMANFTNITAGSALRFQNGATYTISGTLTLAGAFGDEITMDTDDGLGAAFVLDVTSADQVVHRVDVSNSEASSHDILAVNSINSGGTDAGGSSPQWVFVDIYAGGSEDGYDDDTYSQDTPPAFNTIFFGTNF